MQRILQHRFASHARNVWIALLLLLMTVQAAPVIPGPIRDRMTTAAHWLGIGHHEWNLFAPEPDMTNHRVWAKVTFADGSIAEWRTPDWRTQSWRQRFVTHRLSQYCNLMHEGGRMDAWDSLTDYLARKFERERTSSGRVIRVELWVKQGLLREAELTPWPSIAQPPPLNDQWQFHTKDFSP